MIHLLWSLLNAFVGAYFIVLLFGLIFTGRRVLEGRFKTISVIVLVIGIIQVTGASDDKPENRNTKFINDMPEGHHNNASKFIKLEDNLSMDIILGISYTDLGEAYLPTSSYSQINGLVSGFDWKFISIQTGSYIEGSPVAYEVHGVLEWHLFGIRIYSQSKTFKGIIE